MNSRPSMQHVHSLQMCEGHRLRLHPTPGHRCQDAPAPFCMPWVKAALALASNQLNLQPAARDRRKRSPSSALPLHAIPLRRAGHAGLTNPGPSVLSPCLANARGWVPQAR
jgi:hypothetical protein